MSIFSSLRKSRQLAKEHNAKLAEQKKQDSSKSTPYRHIPTHAASDAISSAPPAWREAADRPRIAEHNRRRSAMAAAGLSMNMPSTTNVHAIPRVSSSLSYVSYPSGQATPHVGMPRAYSSNSIHHPYGAGAQVVYTMPEAALSQPSSWKGKEVTRNSLSPYDTSVPSSALISKEPTPEGSSRASNSSHDELEIATVPSGRPKTTQAHSSQASQIQPQQFQPQPQTQPVVTVQQPQQPAQPVQSVQSQDTLRPDSAASVHRLHPSHHRSSSELSEKSAGQAAKPTPRDARPPPTSKRGFNFISNQQQTQQPVAAPVPGKLPQPESDASTRPSSAHQQARPGMGYSGFAPKPPAMPAVAPPAARSSSDYNLGSFAIPSPGLSLSGGNAVQPSAGQAQYHARMKDHYATKQREKQEMEPIVSSGYARHTRAEMPPPVSHDSLVNIFPEPAPESYDSKASRGKISKGKKSRWSFTKSSAIPA